MAAAFTGNENIQSYDPSHQRRPFNIPDPNGELWRECAAWLTKWEVIRQDHKSNWPSASIADLANILRDGVLLCKLLNKIDPGSIDMKDVNLKPTLAQVNNGFIFSLAHMHKKKEILLPTTLKANHASSMKKNTVKTFRYLYAKHK